MNDRITPVTGPHRIHITTIPTGAQLDISAYLETAILDLIRNHLDELADLADLDASAQFQLSHGNDDSHAGHERDRRVEELAECLSPRLPVYGVQVAALAEALGEIARPKSLPQQQEAGAA